MKRRRTNKDPKGTDLPTTRNTAGPGTSQILLVGNYDLRRKKSQSGYHRLLKTMLVFLLIAAVIIFVQRLDLKLWSSSSVQVSKQKVLDPWPTPIIHIVNTRFMQHQGNLTTLATARLYLFKTVCLPSMLKQKNQDFLWIIKVDPALDVDIRNKLVDIIHKGAKLHSTATATATATATSTDLRNGNGGTSNGNSTSIIERIFVIGSNVNYLTGHEEGAWRGGIESREVLSHDIIPNLRSRTHLVSEIYTGTVELLYRAKESEPHRIVLETRLDADDGLNEHFVEYVQKDAMRVFGSSSTLHNAMVDTASEASTATDAALEYNWFYWCVESHIKWYLNAEGEYGKLDGERRTDFCITPGLTIGFSIGTDVKDIPKYGHHELYKKLGNSCKNIKDDTSTTNTTPCIGFIKEIIAAVRFRTETSAGMADVQARREDHAQLWELLQQHFGVDTANAIESKLYFQENRKEIAKENLEGQCRGDHSCKDSSKFQLKEIIQAS